MCLFLTFLLPPSVFPHTKLSYDPQVPQRETNVLLLNVFTHGSAATRYSLILSSQWEKNQIQPFCAAAWQEPVGSRDAMEGVGENNGLSGGDCWSSGEKAVKHLLVDRTQSGSNSFSLLCEWPGISADVRWFSGFQLCSLFGMTCHDKSVPSFGNETRWLSFVRAKTFEIYTATSLHYIFC